MTRHRRFERLRWVAALPLASRALPAMVVPALLGPVAALLHVAEAAAVVARGVDEEPVTAPDLAFFANADQIPRDFVLEHLRGVERDGPQEREQVAVLFQRRLEPAGSGHPEAAARQGIRDPCVDDLQQGVRWGAALDRREHYAVQRFAAPDRFPEGRRGP